MCLAKIDVSNQPNKLRRGFYTQPRLSPGSMALFQYTSSSMSKKE